MCLLVCIQSRRQRPVLSARLSHDCSGETTETKVQLEIQSVKISVDVTDGAPPLSAQSVSRDSVSEKVLNNAPNKDERFDSALPLIPALCAVRMDSSA